MAESVLPGVSDGSAERGLSQEGVAHDAGVVPSYVSRVETENYKTTVGILDKVAAAFSLDVSELLALSPPGAEPPAPMRRSRSPRGTERDKWPTRLCRARCRLLGHAGNVTISTLPTA
ncbi:helix-turn-helix transcriptional regulator [Starkeya sp. ORNL1]|nr:helix-turn-helix transcriptional regulator [Starkeya sp. ORNL1]